MSVQGGRPHKSEAEVGQHEPNRRQSGVSRQVSLAEPDLSPRGVAVAFTDRERSFVSEASVYRLLKARGLVTSPAFIVMKAADKFANPTTAINQRRVEERAFGTIRPASRI